MNNDWDLGKNVDWEDRIWAKLGFVTPIHDPL